MSRRQSPFPRKPLPIKRNDGEPLTRVDLQYDFLTYVFADTTPAFTDPHTTLTSLPPGTRVSFRDLYVNAILHSPKATKGLKDSMMMHPDFATDFAMLALLTNVGRVHTTMSFFAEKKTAVRTYHPIPALERVEGNLQDAPRIKALLKACLLPGEDPRYVLSSPNEILARARSGKVPPTSMPNIIFVLTNHSPAIAQEHFLHEIEFIDLFLPLEISSYSRARALLWLCYHYHESTSSTSDDDYDTQITRPNPFCDHHRPGKAPAFVMLTRAEAERENVDTEEEKLRAELLINRRTEVVNKISRFMAAAQADPTGQGSSSTAKKTRTPARPNLTPQEKKERKALWDRQYRERQKEKALLEKSKAQGGQPNEPNQEVKPSRQSNRKRNTTQRDVRTISPQASLGMDNPESMCF
ncbi:hypothetical protein CPB85DRAFT_42014 [Mucidula mucida]|nr:hypothetical protein CPB85DRAFT_42014 [Mucidula mucida]